MTERWYLGSMNDGLFIIDAPPSPAPYDGPIPREYGPNVIVSFGAMAATPELSKVAQAICDAHNASISTALASARREGEEAMRENAEMREALRPFAEATADIDDETDDGQNMWEHPASLNVTAGDFRRALAAYAGHARLSAAQRQVLQAMADGHKMVFSRDGENAWLVPTHPTGILSHEQTNGLRDLGLIGPAPHDEDEHVRFGPPDVITPAGRHALSKAER